MASSLSNFLYNLTEVIHKIKDKHVHDNKRYETSGIKYKKYRYFLQNTNIKDY